MPATRPEPRSMWEGGIGMRHVLLPPEDAEAPQRARRLRELGIGDRPVPEFDDFARELAVRSGGGYGMVNFIDGDRQYLAGLYTSLANSPIDASNPAARAMNRQYGYCPHVVVRRRALVLEDVRDYPRFAGNPVVDEIGIHSYLGAPLIDHTGTALGTICVVDPDPQPWGHDGLRFIKDMAARLVERINAMDRTTPIR